MSLALLLFLPILYNWLYRCFKYQRYYRRDFFRISHNYQLIVPEFGPCEYLLHAFNATTNCFQCWGEGINRPYFGRKKYHFWSFCTIPGHTVDRTTHSCEYKVYSQVDGNVWRIRFRLMLLSVGPWLPNGVVCDFWAILKNARWLILIQIIDKALVLERSFVLWLFFCFQRAHLTVWMGNQTFYL